MPKIRRLIGDSDASELAFVGRERTPSEAMQLGIQMHLGGVSQRKQRESPSTLAVGGSA
jgi:hypothetical protein